MKQLDVSAWLEKFRSGKYVLLVLALGLLLLLLPTGSSTQPEEAAADALVSTGVSLEREGEKLSALLAATQGVGRAEVLLSHSGAVVLCDGAASASVRLTVTNAVASYTGLGCDKIQVMKMK